MFYTDIILTDFVIVLLYIWIIIQLHLCFNAIMKFDFNFFHLISMILGWHISCRRSQQVSGQTNINQTQCIHITLPFSPTIVILFNSTHYPSWRHIHLLLTSQSALPIYAPRSSPYPVPKSSHATFFEFIKFARGFLISHHVHIQPRA